MEFSEKEKAVLRIVQGNLPDSLTPYADIGQACGMSEAEILGFLRKLKASGAIRRFGASIRHQQAGWDANAMVAWKATREQADICGPVAAGHSLVSHVYYRPSPDPGWPYEFFTMIHGRSEEQCRKVAEELAASWPLKDYILLESVTELKKTSMTYF